MLSGLSSQSTPTFGFAAQNRISAREAACLKHAKKALQTFMATGTQQDECYFTSVVRKLPDGAKQTGIYQALQNAIPHYYRHLATTLEKAADKTPLTPAAQALRTFMQAVDNQQDDMDALEKYQNTWDALPESVRLTQEGQTFARQAERILLNYRGLAATQA